MSELTGVVSVSIGIKTRFASRFVLTVRKRAVDIYRTEVKQQQLAKLVGLRGWGGSFCACVSISVSVSIPSAERKNLCLLDLFQQSASV